MTYYGIDLIEYCLQSPKQAVSSGWHIYKECKVIAATVSTLLSFDSEAYTEIANDLIFFQAQEVYSD